jgi:hypothetical protein
MVIQLVRFEKTGGPLTKRISLGAAGKIISDGSACVMSQGTAHRLPIADIGELGDIIHRMGSHEALGLGALRPSLPDHCRIITKRNLPRLTGSATPDQIARTREFIDFGPDRPAFALLDYDTKGMPDDVKERLERAGGFWPALQTIVPDLAKTAHLLRASTSAGLYHSETKKPFAGSGGLHAYVAVADGTDIERFLGVLHDRCWLAGFGWKMVGAGGQLLERSIIDRMVGLPERLCFEGAAIIEPPLRQNEQSRKPQVRHGYTIDTLTVCPALMLSEKSRLEEMCAKEARRLAGDAAKARAEFISKRTERLVKRGMTADRAREVIERQCHGVLLPDIALPWDDEELRGKIVADILADPLAFEGETLADPVEGVEYGAGKAKLMCDANGNPWIHSFAHGRTIYALKFDTAAVRAAIDKAAKEDAVRVFVRLALQADLKPDEVEELKKHAAERSGLGPRAIGRAYQEARKAQAQERAKETHQKRLAERLDPRPQLDVPEEDAPWLPAMDILNDVLGSSTMTEPPMRDAEGANNRKHMRSVPGMHGFRNDDANSEDTTET